MIWLSLKFFKIEGGNKDIMMQDFQFLLEDTSQEWSFSKIIWLFMIKAT